MLAEARSLLDLSKAHLEQPYESPADVLVVYDMESFNYVRPARADRLTSRITEAMTDSLLGTGAAVDRIFLMDLPRVAMARYKLVIFGNSFMLNEAQRDYIRNHVINDGRTVIFMSGAGYTDGKRNDAGLISNLTGMQIELAAETESEAAVTMNGQKFALDTRGVLSRFKVTDSNARPIGNYSSGETAAAVKDVNGCTVYYFGVPLKADLGLFKALLAGTGARIWVENTVERDYVSVGGGIIAIYSVSGGAKSIKPLAGTARMVNLSPFSVLYFDIRTGAPLNTCDNALSADKSPG